MRKTNQTDWSVPQRQPISALFILFAQTFWEVIKRAWPFLLIPLFRTGDEDSGRTLGKFEFYGIIILVITLIGGFFKYLFFKFYLMNNELIVKRGWIKKQTIVIPLDKIQAVHLEQPLLHQAMNLVKVTIDTAGSANAEVSIDSLRKSMAEDLRMRLTEQGEKKELTSLESLQPDNIPIIRISGNDLLRLSISANHLETFFLIIAFGFTLYDNIREVSESILLSVEGMIPSQTFSVMIFMAIAALIITILLSTVRIFLKFYNLSVFEASSGFRITSGLTTLKERVITSRRVQYISWKANWVRQLLNLRLFRFHLAGDDITNEALKAELPVTRAEFMDVLTRGYHPIPSTEGQPFVTIHRAYIIRGVLFIGLVPAAVLIGVTWYWWQGLSLFLLAYPLLILLFAWLKCRKFRLYAFPEIAFVQRGLFGKEQVLLKWTKLQSVTLKQSIYQRRHGLANVVLTTAGSDLFIKYIPLETATQIVNYALFRIESSREPWM